ncbi:ATP-binding protein [Singulisphaera sp. PoT]|uniref:ATP-binding protein n=1 Tax=Singulisphaera sp. PoT TaxID=3411797 RepID=UPI003BF561C0
MIRTAITRPDDVDLSSCDREPIQIPGSIQPFGILLTFNPSDWTVAQASDNCTDAFGKPVDAVIGSTLADLFGAEKGAALRGWLQNPALERNPQFFGFLHLKGDTDGRMHSVVAHRSEGVVIVELEDASDGEPATQPILNPLIRNFVATMERAATSDELNQLAVVEFRRITDFDRVLIYRFDEDGNGTVVAEARNGETFPSLLGHRFPASDIPSQAREVYRLNRSRLIADATYKPVPIVPSRNPVSGRPLDLTYAALRSVSPVHVEYMRNMKTAASMSFSLLQDGKLWGLISCHHASPRVIPYGVRATGEFLSQVFSLQLEAKQRYADIESRIRLKSIEAKLLAFMAKEEDFLSGLVAHPTELLSFASANGAALVVDGRCTTLGEAPDEQKIAQIVKWLSEKVKRDIYHTDSLSADFPPAESVKDVACGLLALSISKVHRSYILWFRPEIVRTVNWGGDPRKPFSDADARIHPRKSFEIWKETVRNRALPWDLNQIETAEEFRNAIVGIVLRRAEELAELSAELKRSNRELEAFSYSVSHDLRAPFRHIVGYSELLREENDLSESGKRYVDTIIESAQYAGTLVDNLLSFSQMGRTAINPVTVNMTQLFRESIRDVMTEAAGRAVSWDLQDLPAAWCDPGVMHLAVRNLLSNAIKYTRNRAEAKIEIGSLEHDDEYVYFVRDNGTGFDMKYVGKLFGVFQRLHRMEDFEGTGIGLANVRRIVERHGGRAWAEGVLDAGATFYFSLPKVSEAKES